MNKFSQRYLATALAGFALTGGLVASTQSAATAAGGTGSWGTFATTDPTSGATAGTLNLDSPGFTSNSATWTTNSTGVSAPSGNSTWLNTATPSGGEYGTSRGLNYLQIGNARNGADSTTTFNFTVPTPAAGWSFTVGDIDADTLTISAKDKNNNSVAVSTWFQSAFNYCTGTPTPCGTASDVPTWDATSTLTGNGSDTLGAAAWFKPSASISSLTFTYHKLVGFPSFQLWFAGDNNPAQNYKVTFVARQCPTYAAVMANKARNNIAEATSAVGVDSLYSGVNAGPVRPSVEDLAGTGQNSCTPITNWKFATGTKIAGKDTGTFGALSKVGATAPASVQTFTTQSSIPELDQFGTDTGRTISGAVTYNMTADDVANATARKYWVQGGAPGDPLSGQSSSLGFATLRCSIDNANADNVEFASFAATARHMFCYAYYVSNAPQSGNIYIRKYVPAGPNSKFSFGGDVSFTPGGKFSLNSTNSVSSNGSAGEVATFIRAVGEAWTVTEDLPSSPYQFDTMWCYAYAHGGNGSSLTTYSSTWNIDAANRKVVIVLAAGEDVGCVYQNKFAPSAQLELYKKSVGNVGVFPFSVTFTPSGDTSTNVTPNVVTTENLMPVSIFANNAIDPTQPISLGETLPNSYGGHWNPPGTPATIECAAVDSSGALITAPTTSVSNSGAFAATITPNTTNGSKQACTVTNNFVPNASITIKSVIIGGTSSVSVDSGAVINEANGALVDPTDGLTPGLPESFTNTAWNTSGAQIAAESGLYFSGYTVTGISPANTSTETWALDSLVCDGGVNVVIAGSQASFVLNGSSATAPNITCTYTYKITPMFNVVTEVVSPEVPATISEAATIVDTVDAATVEVDTPSTTPAEALNLPLLPAGTVIDIVDTATAKSSAGGTPPAGEWNSTTDGIPTWKCTGSTIRATAQGIRLTVSGNTSCVSHNSFSERPDTLPKSGGGNWFQRALASVRNFFS